MKKVWAAVCVTAWAGLASMAASQNPPRQSVGGAPGASGKRPMTFADLMAMKRVSDPQISPSGKWVLFSVTDVSLDNNTKTNHLWVVPIDGSAPERQVTTGPGESFGRFSPDGTRVSWTQNPGKDEAYARIAVAPWDEKTGTIGAAKALTGISGDADGAVWSPDSKKLMLTTQVYPECSVTDPGRPANPPELRAGGAPGSVGGIEIGGTREVAAWKGMQPAAWVEEDACDKAKDEAAEKSPVKAQVWDGLLYRHWDQFTGAKRTHILVADLAPDNPTRPSFDSAQDRLRARTDGAPDHPANPPELRAGGAPGSSIPPAAVAIRDVTTERDVGDAETPTWMLGGPQEYAWAPDGKEIAYVTNLDAVPAASTNNDVFTLRVDEADARPVKVSTSAGSDDEPEYSPDGKWLAFRSQRQAGFESDRERLMLYDREKKTANEFIPYSDNWVDEFAWSPDSRYIFSVSGYHGAEVIGRLTLAPRSIQNIAGGRNREPSEIRISGRGEFSNVIVSSGGDRIVAAGMTVNSPTEVYGFSSSVGCESPFGDVEPTLSDLAEYDNFCAGTATLSKPGEPRPAFTPIEPATAVTHLNGSLLSQLDLHSLEPFWFTGAEGTKVEGFLLRPPGFDPSKKYPLKFILHGGPQTMAGDSWSYRWNWELMAASGYVVIGINRRGSTGYGQKFVDEVSGDWGGRAYEDLMKGLDYAEAKYPFIDKTRECALGASYGGFMADWILTHTNRFQCIVTHDGLYDAGAAWGSTEEMWFPEWEFRRPEDFPKGWDGFSAGYPGSIRQPTLRDKAAKDGPPESGEGHVAEPWRYAGLPASEDPFRRWSPKEYIQNAKTPTLIIHSQKDYRLDVSQGFELYTALQRLGVPSRFLYFPDEGHWVLKPKDSELWNAAVSDWCDRWTHMGKYAETR